MKPVVLTHGRADYLLSIPFALIIGTWCRLTGRTATTLARLAVLVGVLSVVALCFLIAESWWATLFAIASATLLSVISLVITIPLWDKLIERLMTTGRMPVVLGHAVTRVMFALFSVLFTVAWIEWGIGSVWIPYWLAQILALYCCTTISSRRPRKQRAGIRQRLTALRPSRRLAWG